MHIKINDLLLLGARLADQVMLNPEDYADEPGDEGLTRVEAQAHIDGIAETIAALIGGSMTARSVRETITALAKDEQPEPEPEQTVSEPEQTVSEPKPGATVHYRPMLLPGSGATYYSTTDKDLVTCRVCRDSVRF